MGNFLGSETDIMGERYFMAMPENMKVASLNQEMIRRMINTSEDLDTGERTIVVDDHAQKHISSGFKLDQTRKHMRGS